jgi:hypothetical protein
MDASDLSGEGGSGKSDGVRQIEKEWERRREREREME